MKPFLLQHFLEMSCEKFPDKVAVKHGTESITFKDLYEKGGIHFNGAIFHSHSKEAENYFDPQLFLYRLLV
jgi:hypothetical protein